MASTTQALVGWVGSKLHELLGYSEVSVAQYICAIAVKATSVSALHAQILSADVPDSESSRAFASELYYRVPRARPELQAKRQPTNADLLRQSSKYELVGSDHEDESSSVKRSKSGPSKKSKKQKRREHTRKRGEESSDDEADAGASAVVQASTKRAQERAALDAKGEGGEVDAEAAREADAAERDAFVERMRDRDADRTKKFDLGGLTEKQVKEMATKGTVESTDRTMEEMREISRRLYLEKRESKQLKLAERQLEDESEMFDEDSITELERTRQALSRKVIDMAKEKGRFEETTEGYRIPDTYEQADGKLNLTRGREAGNVF